MTIARRWQIPLAMVVIAYLVAAGLLASALPLKDGAIDWFAPLKAGGWMAWSFPTALFFLTVVLLLARTLTTTAAKPISAIMTRTVSASGLDWGVLAAAGVLTIIPGALVIWFVRNYIAKGFALGRV